MRMQIQFTTRVLIMNQVYYNLQIEAFALATKISFFLLNPLTTEQSNNV